MERKDIEKKVTEVLVDKLGVEPEDVKPEANIMDELGADSLDVVELIMEFEKEFDIYVPDEDAERIRTVKDIIDYGEQNIM